MTNKVDQMVIDEFRRESLLLDRLIFDNAVSPGTGGSTLGYNYIKLKTPSTAQFRAINTEYEPNEADREEHTAYCRPFGGSYQLDRVIIDTSGAVDELAFQASEKIKGAANLFHYTVINGDRAARPLEFDGLDVFLAGSSTEYIPATPIDLQNTPAMDANYMAFVDEMNEFTSLMIGRSDMFMVNRVLRNRIRGVGARAGYYTQSEDAFGRPVDMWDNIPFVTLENFFDEATQTTIPSIPILADGTTALYAIQIALDGFHGISPLGNSIIRSYLPDQNAPGAVKYGDVEMVAGCALKNSLKAGVMRGIRVR
jgi:hypothetical protein